MPVPPAAKAMMGTAATQAALPTEVARKAKDTPAMSRTLLPTESTYRTAGDGISRPMMAENDEEWVPAKGVQATKVSPTNTVYPKLDFSSFA